VLTILSYGLIAVFLNIEIGIKDLNEKVDGLSGLDATVKNVGKVTVNMANLLNAINTGINKKND